MIKDAASLAVSDPAMLEVLDKQTGKLIPAGEAIGSDYGKVMSLRMTLRQSIAEGSPRYVCPVCGVAVYLVSQSNARRFFFRHHREDGRCPTNTRGQLSEAEICAMKYNGVKESDAHRRIKEIVAESLRSDPGFSNVKVEAVMHGRDRAWRRPDVQAMFDGIPVAFEIQLSTTFLRVIAERRAFYLREGGLLVWIFGSFDEECARLTQDDVFYSNNRNLFLVGEETLRASRAAGKFVLDCRWAEPFIEAGEIQTRWGGSLAAFSELQIDRKRQRVFLFDYEQSALTLRARDAAPLRREFEQLWLSRRNQDPYDPDAWNGLRRQFAARGIGLPTEPNWGGAPSHLLNVAYSCREGHPVGWRFRRLVDVARHVATRHKPLLRALLHALDVYHRWGQIEREDIDGRWRRELEACMPRLVANSPEYEPESRFRELVDLLFPELGASEEGAQPR